MIKWIVFINSILLYCCTFCEDVIRPKSKKECFQRTLVGEFNKDNAYCCYLNFIKQGYEISKCSIHFKKEIDNEEITNTIKFLKEVNTHYGGEIVEINTLDCISKYFKTNIFIFIFIYFIMNYLNI